MASGAVVSGLDRLVEAVEATERAARLRASALRTADGFLCPHPGCGRVFSKRYNQQAHMRIHDGTRPFGCELCGKRFMWKSSLKSHAKMHAKRMGRMEGAVGKRRKTDGKKSVKQASKEVSRRDLETALVLATIS